MRASIADMGRGWAGRAAVAAAIAGGGLAWAASPAHAATVEVNCPDDSLQAAIAAASPGDTLLIAGTCVGNFVVDKPLTLQSQPFGTATLDGNQTGRTLLIGADVTLGALKITNGLSDRGAGIFVEPGHTLNGSGFPVGPDIAGNEATFAGGGLWVAATGRALLDTARVAENTATRGGGILNEGFVRMDGTVVGGNTAQLGAGMENMGEAWVLTGSLIHQNNALDIGGGIVNRPSATLQMNTSTLRSNGATVSGGGLFNEGVAVVTQSAVVGNTTSGVGGGIANAAAAVAPLGFRAVNTTISGNTADESGGGVHHGSGSTGLQFVTVANNTTGIHTAAVDDPGSFHLEASIVADNSQGDCSDSPTSPITPGGYNLIEDATNCWYAAQPTDVLGADPLLEPLSGNGGSTLNHALQPGSPALNRIPSPECTSTTLVDQRGASRPQAGLCEIGSFEKQAPTLDPEAVTVDVTITGEVKVPFPDLVAHLEEPCLKSPCPPVPGRVVEFFLGNDLLDSTLVPGSGQPVCAVTTNRDGTAVCPDQGLAAALAGGYTAVFRGDPRYEPVSAPGAIVVVGPLRL